MQPVGFVTFVYFMYLSISPKKQKTKNDFILLMHVHAVMVAEGTVLQGAGVKKASVKQSSGRELSDNVTGTECSEVPVASQRVVPSGLTPPMLNLNISGVSSLQSCKEVHLEKMTQKQYQSTQTGKDGKEASRFLQETQAAGAEASRKCSTVTILKEASFSDVFRCQVAEKSVSNDKVNTLTQH